MYEEYSIIKLAKQVYQKKKKKNHIGVHYSRRKFSSTQYYAVLNIFE